MKLIAKYETEQKNLTAEVVDLEEKLSTIRQYEEDVALFMERLKSTLMCRSLHVRCAWS